MTPSPAALLMAGGRGERMRASGVPMAKPLVPVRGLTLLERNLWWLLDAGFRHIVVATPASLPEVGELARTVGGALARAWGGGLEVFEETEPLGTIGALARIEAPGPVLVANADNLMLLDPAALLAAHERTGAAMTVAVHEQPFRIPYAEVLTGQGDRVVGYREKPELPVRVASAVYAVAADVRAGLPPGRLDAPQLVDSLLRQDRPVRAWHHAEPWIDVNDAGTAAAAEALVARHRDRFELHGRAPDVEVAGALLIRDGAVLLEHRAAGARLQAGVWDSPGGKLEPGEAPVAAMRRELHEELGHAPEPLAAVACFDDLDPTSGAVVRHHVFTAPGDADLRPRLGQTLAWWPLTGLPPAGELATALRRSLAWWGKP